MPAILTQGREAVWNAINNADALRVGGQSVFKRQVRFDDSEAPFMEADDWLAWLGYGDLPALAIWTQEVSMGWAENTAQEWIMPLLIRMATPNHSLPEPENLAEQVVLAIHETQIPGTTVSFVKRATSYHPVGAGNFVFTPEYISEAEDSDGENAIKIVETTFNLSLRFKKAVC